MRTNIYKDKLYFAAKYFGPVLILLVLVISLFLDRKNTTTDLIDNGIEGLGTVYSIDERLRGSDIVNFYYLHKQDTFYSSSFMPNHKMIEVGKTYKIVFSKINPKNNQIYFD